MKNPIANFLMTKNKTNLNMNSSTTTFLATICHELRNPLSAVVGCAELLQKDQDKISEEELREFLGYIRTSGREALNLVNDLMDVSKYNSGSFSVNLNEKIDVKEIINRSIRVKKEEALRRRIRIINNSTNQDIPLINLDPQRMKQVLVNLISNAIKYSPDNTTITIDAKINGPRHEDGVTNLEDEVTNSGHGVTKLATLQIDVVDQGFGMTKEELKIAMEPFQTINNPNTGKVDCFGLGLPLVKDLVDLQKGEMRIESVKGQGTKISLFFAS